jgi:hypothetical protein
MVNYFLVRVPNLGNFFSTYKALIEHWMMMVTIFCGKIILRYGWCPIHLMFVLTTGALKVREMF